MSTPDHDIDRKLQDLTVRLQEAELACAAKDAFIGAISRELNNPLGPVLLAVERLRALLDGGDTARLEASVQLLERATEGFARRTRMLLDLADLSAGITSLRATRLDAAAAIGAVVAGSAEMARLADCELVVAAAPGLHALADPEALSQVLEHILANALRFGAGRPVRLSAGRGPSGACVITIADQGPGLGADRLQGLFDLFAQARTPREPGLGIGLWIASQLVSAMHGTITVQSTPGHGAHFHVSLPTLTDSSVAPVTQSLQTP